MSLGFTRVDGTGDGGVPAVYTCSVGLSLNLQQTVVSWDEGGAYPPSGTKVNEVFVGTEVVSEGTIVSRGQYRSRAFKGVLPVIPGPPALLTPSLIGACFVSFACPFGMFAPGYAPTKGSSGGPGSQIISLWSTGRRGITPALGGRSMHAIAISHDPLHRCAVYERTSLSPMTSTSTYVLSDFSAGTFRRFGLSPLATAELSPFYVPTLSGPPPNVARSAALKAGTMAGVKSSFTVSGGLVSNVCASTSFPSHGAIAMHTSTVSQDVSAPGHSGNFSSTQEEVSPSQGPVSQTHSLGFVP